VNEAPPMPLFADESVVGSEPHKVSQACTSEQACKSWLSSVPGFSTCYGMKVTERAFGPLSLALSSNSWVRLSRRHVSMYHYPIPSGRQLHRINRCRLSLQILTILDVTTGYGTTITKAACNRERDTTRTSRYQWPT
jgi:hypothetical protein